MAESCRCAAPTTPVTRVQQIWAENYNGLIAKGVSPDHARDIVIALIHKGE